MTQDNNNNNNYTLRDLAELVEERELWSGYYSGKILSNIAYDSETRLLGEFVRMYDHTQTIIETEKGDKMIDSNIYTAWSRAYDLMEQYEDDGVGYELSDLF